MKSVFNRLGTACLMLLIAAVAGAQNPGDVVINEVMYDDINSTDIEWVELHNTTASAIVLDDWILTDDSVYPPNGGEGALRIPAATSIPANGYLVISREDLPEITGEVMCTQYIGSWILGNGGDNLALYTSDPGGTLIDGSLTLRYPDHSPGNLGYSVEKCDEESPWTDLAAAWHASTNEFSTVGSYRFCTPGTANSVCAPPVDNDPPFLSFASATSLTEVSVRFNEPVSLATSQTVTNYTVNNSVGNPLTATRDGADSSIVHLTFNTLADNQYEIVGTSVEDTAGNAMPPDTAIFAIRSAAIAAGAVVISEVMYDDTAGIDAEWVEVYNTTGSTIDISGMVMTDATAWPPFSEGVLLVPQGTSLAAGQYLVLTPAALPEFTGEAVCATAYGLFGLNNGGDNLALLNPVGGTMIYGSLTDLYPDLSTSNVGNSIEVCLNNLGADWATLEWYESDAVFSATGRYRNCSPNAAPLACAVDETPPTILSAFAPGNLAVDVTFDENLDQATAETAANYVVDPGAITPVTAALDGGNNALVHLAFAAPLADGFYTVTATNVEDLAGNPSNTTSPSFEVSSVTVNPGDVVITEVMYDDTASGDAEWVELFNTTAGAIDLSGWILQDDDVYPAAGEGVIEIPNGTTISPGQYLVFGKNVDVLTYIPSAIMCAEPFGSFALGNSGDNISLYTSISGGIQVYGALSGNYPDLSQPANVGNSIEVCESSVGDEWGALQWYESDTEYSTTGRYRNCTPGSGPHSCVDLTPPQVVSASLVTDFQVDVFFNEIVETTTAQTAANYTVDLGVGNPTGAVLLSGNESVRLTFAAAFTPNTYTVTVINVQDLAGNPIAGNNSAQFTVADVADIIITEFMPNPNHVGLADSLGEWFEIYNGEATSVDLAGWIISDGGGSDTIEAPAVVAAGEYFVFCSNGDLPTNGGVPTDYDYVYGTFGFGLGLNNSGELVSLHNSNGDLVASVDYTGLPFFAGISCQLRDLSYNPAIDTNWCSAGSEWTGATNGDFGTPGEATVCAPPSVGTEVTICDIRAQDACGISDWDAEHLITFGVVAYNDSCRRNIYVEDNGCAVLIYGNAARDPMDGHTRHPEAGDSVRIEGTLTRYNGLTEFSDGTLVPAVVTYLGAAATPAEVTIANSLWASTVEDCGPESYESRHVIAEDVTFSAGDGIATFSGSTNYFVVSGADSGVFRVNFCDTLVGTLIPVGPINLHGTLGQYDPSSCYCGGYQMMTGEFAPFQSSQIQCTDPVSLTNFFNSVTGNVEIRWSPGLGQLCDCYSIFYSDITDAAFPAEYNFLDCVCGLLEYIDSNPLAVYRTYVVVAQEACGQ